VPKYFPDEASAWSSETNYDDKYKGTLYITNKRLLFERWVGAIRKKAVLAAEIPLSEITSVSVEKGPWDWTVLIIDVSEHKHRFLFRTKSPDELIKRISELMTIQKGTGKSAAP